MKYFVTGATGFIGGQVARQLAQAGHNVHALVRDPSKAADLIAQGISVHPGDMMDRGSLRRPMAGVDGVFHSVILGTLSRKCWSAGESIDYEW